MILDTLIEKVQSARTVTLSQVITELFPFFYFCNSKLVRSISLNVLQINK